MTEIFTLLCADSSSSSALRNFVRVWASSSQRMSFLPALRAAPSASSSLFMTVRPSATDVMKLMLSARTTWHPWGCVYISAARFSSINLRSLIAVTPPAR